MQGPSSSVSCVVCLYDSVNYGKRHYITYSKCNRDNFLWWRWQDSWAMDLNTFECHTRLYSCSMVTKKQHVPWLRDDTMTLSYNLKKSKCFVTFSITSFHTPSYFSSFSSLHRLTSLLLHTLPTYLHATLFQKRYEWCNLYPLCFTCML